jgi:hypothetical protein
VIALPIVFCEFGKILVTQFTNPCGKRVHCH